MQQLNNMNMDFYATTGTAIIIFAVGFIFGYIWGRYNEQQKRFKQQEKIFN